MNKQEALTELIKVAADLVTKNLSDHIEDWCLPIKTPLKTKRIILDAIRKHNNNQVLRSHRIKAVVDALREPEKPKQ